ncbi:hypothetical protein PR048_014753 [Dryococelus australis]|uniref:Uncharacterized protein n=1 Tax=Dryococelus australis TaxID=614101 RepID=A0ABQ9HF11_9NEOP|nr:hypothetical protein PR048_014753 [Dryococelus australis]
MFVPSPSKSAVFLFELRGLADDRSCVHHFELRGFIMLDAFSRNMSTTQVKYCNEHHLFSVRVAGVAGGRISPPPFPDSTLLDEKNTHTHTFTHACVYNPPRTLLSVCDNTKASTSHCEMITALGDFGHTLIFPLLLILPFLRKKMLECTWFAKINNTMLFCRPAEFSRELNKRTLPLRAGLSPEVHDPVQAPLPPLLCEGLEASHPDCLQISIIATDSKWHNLPTCVHIGYCSLIGTPHPPELPRVQNASQPLSPYSSEPTRVQRYLTLSKHPCTSYPRLQSCSNSTMPTTPSPPRYVQTDMPPTTLTLEVGVPAVPVSRQHALLAIVLRMHFSNVGSPALSSSPLNACLERFNPTRYPFNLTQQTDHVSLHYLKCIDKLNIRIQKLVIALTEYDFEAKIVKGKLNTLTDVLSRIPRVGTADTTTVTVNATQYKVKCTFTHCTSFHTALADRSSKTHRKPRKSK